MPLSCFKRPAAVVLFLYIVLIVLLDSRGLLRAELPRELRRFAYRTVSVEGILLSGFSPKQAGDRYWVRVDRIGSEPQPEFTVMAYLSRKDPDTRRLRTGQRVRLTGRLRPPLWPRDPGGFDEREFLDRRGAVFVLHARAVELLGRGVSPLRLAWAAGDACHRSIHEYLRGRFPPGAAAILEGLMLGYKGRLPAGLGRAVQDAGVAYMLAPTGAKVTFFLAAALGLAALLGFGPAGQLAAAAAAGGAYVLVVGPEPPYTRAYFMALVFYAGWAVGRESGGFQALVLSALATLLADPRELFSAGFQMSYLAMLGIVIALPRWLPPRSWQPWTRLVASAAAMGFIVQLMLWPTFAAFFGRVSLAGPVVNMAFIPAAGPVMAAGFLAWAAGSAGWTFIERPFSWAAWASADVFAAVCRRVGAVPGSAMDLAPLGTQALAVYYLSVIGILVLPRLKTAAAWWAAAAFVAAAGLALSPGPRLRALFLARPGSPALVTSPEGRHFLVDKELRPSALRPVFRALGVRRAERIQISDGSSLLLSYKNLSIRWEGWGAGVRAGGKEEICIMTASSAESALRCPYDRSYVTRRDGAVWLYSDGTNIEIETQAARHTPRRALP